MIHCHLPVDTSTKRAPLKSACGIVIDPSDRDVRSYLCVTPADVKRAGVDCKGCLAAMKKSS